MKTGSAAYIGSCSMARVDGNVSLSTKLKYIRADLHEAPANKLSLRFSSM